MIKNRVSAVSLPLLLVLVLSSCSPVNFKPLFKSKYDTLTDTLKGVKVINPDPANATTYRIQVEDMLNIRNSTYQQITESTGTQNSGGGSSGSGSVPSGYRVEADGYISLPKVGKVYVLGLTRREATEKIQGLYKDSLLADPVFDVAVIGPRVTVLGEVQSQGTFYLDRDNISLVEILGLAGGFNTRSDPKTLKIIRGDKANPEIIYVNLQDIHSLASSKIMLQNKDIIYVEADKKVIEYERKESKINVFQTLIVLISTGFLIYSFFK